MSFSSASTKRGAFILLEGLDRSGKSSQCALLVAHLAARSFPTHLRRFPERSTAIGQLLNGYLAQGRELDDHAVHLLFAANRWEASAELMDSLKQGEHQVVDRFSYSGIAFTCAKASMSSEADLDWCWQPERGLPAPDLTFFLTMDASEAEARGGYGQERYEKLEFQRVVKERFLQLGEREAKRGRPWVIIEAGKGRTVEEIAAEIAQRTDEFISQMPDHAEIRLLD